jgi:hypothetical protein
MNLINRVINHDYSDIVSLDKATLEAVCDYLGIAKKISVFSKMGFKIETPTSADEWALNICKALKVPEYWNPPGGKEFFDKSKYQKAGVNLKFQKIVINEYNQKRPIFEAGLSIVDVMMFNDQSNINKMLDNYELT